MAFFIELIKKAEANPNLNCLSLLIKPLPLEEQLVNENTASFYKIWLFVVFIYIFRNSMD
jgi:hypothetical protein